MPKITYRHMAFTSKTQELIDTAERIIIEYMTQGFTLSLRQLYYQLVARGLLPNRQREYKRLGRIINDARMAGHIDWSAIVDRSRSVRELSHWDSPASILSSAAYSYRENKWATQPRRVEVWIEKDALVGVIEGICNRLDTPFFSCRGYPSASSVWRAGQRILARQDESEQETLILHLGDHDPSGIDMTRDIYDRVSTFTYGMGFDVERIALTMEQINELQPPPNPTKLTDSRAHDYIMRYGHDSWELDALEPAYLEELIESAILKVRDDKLWEQAISEEEDGRDWLQDLADKWDK